MHLAANTLVMSFSEQLTDQEIKTFTKGLTLPNWIHILEATPYQIKILVVERPNTFDAVMEKIKELRGRFEVGNVLRAGNGFDIYLMMVCSDSKLNVDKSGAADAAGRAFR